MIEICFLAACVIPLLQEEVPPSEADFKQANSFVGVIHSTESAIFSVNLVCVDSRPEHLAIERFANKQSTIVSRGISVDSDDCYVRVGSSGNKKWIVLNRIKRSLRGGSSSTIEFFDTEKEWNWNKATLKKRFEREVSLSTYLDDETGTPKIICFPEFPIAWDSNFWYEIMERRNNKWVSNHKKLGKFGENWTASFSENFYCILAPHGRHTRIILGPADGTGDFETQIPGSNWEIQEIVSVDGSHFAALVVNHDGAQDVLLLKRETERLVLLETITIDPNVDGWVADICSQNEQNLLIATIRTNKLTLRGYRLDGELIDTNTIVSEGRINDASIHSDAFERLTVYYSAE